MADLLLRDGVPTNVLNVPQPDFPQRSELSERRKGIRRGAKILFFSLVLFLPMLVWSIAEDFPGPLLLPGTLFLTGCFWMLYYRLFGEERIPAPRPAQPPQFGPPPQQAYFPQQPIAQAYRPPVETPKEHSVVEHTTRSLGQQ